MLSVTSLSAYLYCPRKLYLEKVLEFIPPPKDVLVKGTINHLMFDLLNKTEEKIVTSIKTSDLQSIINIYKQNYSLLLKDIIKNKIQSIKEVNLDPLNLFEEFWQTFEEEALFRATNVYDFIKEYNIYGQELWNKLTPKYLTEIKIKSDILGLSGIIDKIEINNDLFIPIELKTGSPPRQGAWPGHRVQLIAYLLLIKEKFKKDVKHGFIEYVTYKEKRHIILNPFSEEEVYDLIKEINSLLSSKEVPEIQKNKNKCNSCSLKEQCYNFKNLKIKE